MTRIGLPAFHGTLLSSRANLNVRLGSLADIEARLSDAIKLLAWLELAAIPYEQVIEDEPRKGPKGKNPKSESPDERQRRLTRETEERMMHEHYCPPRQQHLPQRDSQPAHVGIGDQPDLLAGQP